MVAINSKSGLVCRPYRWHVKDQMRKTTKLSCRECNSRWFGSYDATECSWCGVSEKLVELQCSEIYI